MLQTAAESLDLARRHLVKVQAAWDDPTDWADLSLYGFLCLEACVVAAVLHLGRQRPSTHPRKASEARLLADAHGLPEVEGLLIDLNARRKHEGYGDSSPPEDLDPENVATTIMEYIEAIEGLLGQ